MVASVREGLVTGKLLYPLHPFKRRGDYADAADEDKGILDLSAVL